MSPILLDFTMDPRFFSIRPGHCAGLSLMLQGFSPSITLRLPARLSNTRDVYKGNFSILHGFYIANTLPLHALHTVYP